MQILKISDMNQIVYAISFVSGSRVHYLKLSNSIFVLFKCYKGKQQFMQSTKRKTDINRESLNDSGAGELWSLHRLSSL